MSAGKHQPWFKWYVANWLAEPRLKMVSRAARSLWVDILCLMHEAEPCGFLIVARKPLTCAAQIARALGDVETEIAPLLVELEGAGVFSRVGDSDLPRDIIELIPETVSAGTILSRKMVRDKAASERGREHGALGGNPALKVTNDDRGLTPGITHGLTGGLRHRRQKTES